MKVKELIFRLKAINPDLDVKVQGDIRFGEVLHDITFTGVLENDFGNENFIIDSH